MKFEISVFHGLTRGKGKDVAEISLQLFILWAWDVKVGLVKGLGRKIETLISITTRRSLGPFDWLNFFNIIIILSFID